MKRRVSDDQTERLATQLARLGGLDAPALAPRLLSISMSPRRRIGAPRSTPASASSADSTSS
jgi:hypothetical protein